MIEKVLGLQIRKLRKSLSMTQPELSKKSGVGIQSITLIETGKQWPRIKNLESIAVALNTTKEKLFADCQLVDPAYDLMAAEINRLKSQDQDLSDEEKELLHSFRALEPIQREAILDSIQPAKQESKDRSS